MSRLATALLLAACLFAAPAPEFERARELYQRTEYQASLNLLLPLARRLGNDGAGELQLIGQDYFMLGEYKKSADAFDRALVLALGSASQQLYMWAGRAYGRRAESSSP